MTVLDEIVADQIRTDLPEIQSGDTVRVSLTEDPVREIPVARALVEPYCRAAERAEPPARPRTPAVAPRDPYAYTRRSSREIRVGPLALG